MALVPDIKHPYIPPLLREISAHIVFTGTVPLTLRLLAELEGRPWARSVRRFLRKHGICMPFRIGRKGTPCPNSIPRVLAAMRRMFYLECGDAYHGNRTTFYALSLFTYTGDSASMTYLFEQPCCRCSCIFPHDLDRCRIIACGFVDNSIRHNGQNHPVTLLLEKESGTTWRRLLLRNKRSN